MNRFLFFGRVSSCVDILYTYCGVYDVVLNLRQVLTTKVLSNLPNLRGAGRVSEREGVRGTAQQKQIAADLAKGCNCAIHTLQN